MAESTTIQSLSKKQKKALEFRSKKKSGESTDAIKEDRKAKKRAREEEKAEESSSKKADASKDKKIKTGNESEEGPTKKKIKGSGKSKKKFILFIGNLPYNVTEEEIQEHFKAAAPLTLRPRKGFSFAEFEGNDAARRLNVALRLHHTTFKHRKINVELTAGGGGNTVARRQKVKDRNEKLRQEFAEQAEEVKKEKKAKSENGGSKDSAEDTGIHPDRLKQMH